MQRFVEVSTPVRAPLGLARDVLGAEPTCLFADGVSQDHRRRREVRAELAVELGSGAAVSQEVLVAIGTARPGDDGDLSLPVSWRPVGHRRVLPGFTGEITVAVDGDGSTRLGLAGTYDVPLGHVGRFGDGLVGRRVALGTLTALVESAAARLDAEADHRSRTVPFRPAPYAPDLRESPGSENHLG
jgi:hypothetical protein